MSFEIDLPSWWWISARSWFALNWSTAVRCGTQWHGSGTSRRRTSRRRTFRRRERLKKLMSLQRRRERYCIIHVWKILNGHAPNDINFEFSTNERLGVKAFLPPLNNMAQLSVKTDYDNSFRVRAPQGAFRRLMASRSDLVGSSSSTRTIHLFRDTQLLNDQQNGIINYKLAMVWSARARTKITYGKMSQLYLFLWIWNWFLLVKKDDAIPKRDDIQLTGVCPHLFN